MANAYEIVMNNRKELIDALIKNMEQGYIWTKDAWSSAALRPYNPASDCYYLGGNRVRLMLATLENNYDDPRWCTYNQAQENGWAVKRGAKSVLLEKWIFTETKTVENKQGKLVKETVDLERPKVNYFRVFNASQIHGIPKLEAAPEPAYDSIIDTAFRSSKCFIAEKAVPQAHYILSHDVIEIPSRFSFKSAESYLSVLIHEMSHSTGHPDRLNRQILNKFGTPDYAREELRAELGSAFFKCNLNLPLSTEQLQDHSNYLKSWIQVLKDDPNEFFRACRDAEKISDYLQKNYEQVLEKQAINSIENLSEKAEREIIFKYETVNKIPETERMTKWYTEMSTPVQNKPISETMIQQRCAEILSEISQEDLDMQYQKYWFEVSGNITDNVIAQVDILKSRAAEDMQRQGSLHGSWFGTIAHPDRPEDYIQIDITGYNTTNTVVESATIVMGGNVQDTIIHGVNANEYLQLDVKNNTGFAQQIAEKALDFDPSIQSEYRLCLYAPLGLSEHSLEEHYRLLRERGYSEHPNYDSYNLKMHNFLLPNEERLPEHILPEKNEYTKLPNWISLGKETDVSFYTINIYSNDIPSQYDTLEEALHDYFTQPSRNGTFDSRTLLVQLKNEHGFYSLLSRECGIDIVNPDRLDDSRLKPFLEKATEKFLEHQNPNETYMDRISLQIENNGLHMTDSLKKNLDALHSVTGKEYYIGDFASLSQIRIENEEAQQLAKQIYSECRQQEWEHLQELMAEECLDAEAL